MQRAIKWLKQAEQIAILYDFDVDGITACAIVMRMLERLGKKAEKFVASPKPSFERNPAFDLVKGMGNIIILDISLKKEDAQYFKDLNILNVDHHETGMKKSSGEVVVFKNRGDYRPTAKMVYDLGMKMFKDFDENDWIASAGVISDFGGPQNREFIQSVHNKYGFSFGKSDDKFFETRLGEIAKVLNSIRTAGDITKAGVAVKALLECDNPKEFLESRNPKIKLLYKSYEKIQSTIDHELERFEKKAKKNKGRELFYLNGQKYNIRSTLSTIISAKHEQTIAIAEKRNTGYIHISMRSRNEDVLGIIEEVKKKIEAAGGGHKKAAGLTIKEEDLEEFKKIFLRL